jgi:penicillin-binding protein 1B
MVKRLGVTRELDPYPSMLLGAMSLTPLEMTQMYQTLASGGFHTPLRAIREVLTADGAPLQRYPLAIEQVIDPAPVFLLTTALQEAVRQGTARTLSRSLALSIAVAGKTGTTDDLRDSWFAGFTGSHLAVVWLGRDNNLPTGLTGASGALTVWDAMMRRVSSESLRLMPPQNVEFITVDARWRQAEAHCLSRGPALWPAGPRTWAPACGSQESYSTAPKTPAQRKTLFERLRGIFR